MKLVAIAIALAASAVQSFDVPGEVEEARTALGFVESADRPVAIRNFAEILIDAGRCDEAVALFTKNEELGPLLIDTAVHHAVENFQLPCAAKLGLLVLERSVPSSGDDVGYPGIRMFAGAALRVGGNPTRGQMAIADAEATLAKKGEGIPDWKYGENVRTLWEARNKMLSVYAGTPYYEPALLQYARELAIDPTTVWTQQSGAIIVRLSAAGRMDLVDSITAKMWPSDKTKVTKSLDVSRRQDAVDIYGKNGVPHCPGAILDDKLETPLERAAVYPPPATMPGPMGTIMRIQKNLDLHVLQQRCPDPFG